MVSACRPRAREAEGDVPFRVVYHASNTRHGLFADFRKILKWCWLADEMGNLDVEVSYGKYDPAEMDVEGFLENIGVNNPGYDRQRDGERVREKFYVGINPLKYFFGLHMPERDKSYQHTFHVENARVSDSGRLLTLLGITPDNRLRRELQNSPKPYYPSAINGSIRRRAHEQLQRCVSLRPETREKIDAIHQRNLAGAGHVIGVHVRFSGHYGALHLRPGCDFNESIVADIDNWMQRNGRDDSTTFLATHLEDLVQLAARNWGDRTFAEMLPARSYRRRFGPLLACVALAACTGELADDTPRRRALIIGIDRAAPSVVNRLMLEGRLPNLVDLSIGGLFAPGTGGVFPLLLAS